MGDGRDKQEIGAVLRDVVSSVGLPFGLSIAQRAERCADELIATEDDDAIHFMIVQGWERELSRDFSRQKKRARKAIDELIRMGVDFVDGNGHVARQMSFPVIAPGQPPLPLVRACHLSVAAALRAEESQLKGRQRHVALLGQIVEATAPWPETPIGDLLGSRILTMERLFGKPTAQTRVRQEAG